MSSLCTRITNDVMDSVGLMEGLINSIKPLYFVVASITIKVRIPAQKTKYQPIAMSVSQFWKFYSIKGMSQGFSDCGLHNDKYTKFQACQNCVFRA